MLTSFHKEIKGAVGLFFPIFYDNQIRSVECRSAKYGTVYFKIRHTSRLDTLRRLMRDA